MNVATVVSHFGGLALLWLPLAAAAQGLVRGPELPLARAQADPPEVQVVRLPSGQVMKQLPGAPDLAARPTPVAAQLGAAASVQQVGNVQLRVMNLPGAAPAAAAAVVAPPANLTVRQVGKAQVLEMQGQPTPGLMAAAPAGALAPLPAGVAVVELAAGQLPPSPPALNTLYRRKPAGS